MDFSRFGLPIKEYPIIESMYSKCSGLLLSIFNNTFGKSKLIFASSYYLNNIDKDISAKYKKFINDKQYTPNEKILLNEFYKEVRK
jgi:hypothetical protein